MDFQWVKSDEYNFVYSRKKLPSGMTVEIKFILYALDNISVAEVELDVYHKRKQSHENWLHITGKDGIKPFVWAWKKIKEFEKYAQTEVYTYSPMYLCVSGSDNKRWRMYKKVLLRRGFELRNFGHGTHLYKFILDKNV